MTLDPKAIRKGDYIISHEPAPRIIEVGDRVDWSPAPDGDLGTVLAFTKQSRLAVVEWDDGSVSDVDPSDLTLISKAGEPETGGEASR